MKSVESLVTLIVHSNFKVGREVWAMWAERGKVRYFCVVKTVIRNGNSQ